MLRHLNSTNERGDRSRRTGDVDPFDSIFVVEVFGRVNGDDSVDESMPLIHSIWCNVSEARVAAERALTQDWPVVPRLARVMEYATNVFQPSVERHAEQRPNDPPPDTKEEEIKRLQIEINRLRAGLGQAQASGVGIPTTTP